MIKVVIADAHKMFRQGLLKLIQSVEDIIVVGAAGDGHNFLELIERERPDVAILDITMPGLNALEVADKIQSLSINTKVIFLAMYKDPVIAHKAILSIASAYLLKDNSFEELLYAIKAVASGGKFISPLISDKIMRLRQANKRENYFLTKRECEILRLIALGYTNKKIADKLNISVKTVETHRTKILQKLNVHKTADLVRHAIKAGLIELE